MIGQGVTLTGFNRFEKHLCDEGIRERNNFHSWQSKNCFELRNCHFAFPAGKGKGAGLCIAQSYSEGCVEENLPFRKQFLLFPSITLQCYRH